MLEEKLAGHIDSILVESVEQLRGSVSGDVWVPGSRRYNEARQVWNGLFDRHPRVIVECASVGDVITGVKFARRHGLPISVRGGGHHLAGQGACDDGLMLDLSNMRSVTVDPERRTARVQGGATAGDVIAATQAYGLAAPTGNAAAVGIGGLTLGGGIGYLRRKYGLTCDNLLGVDLVTADGVLVHASDSENPNLFWALKGGGGNFGIVTEFEFQLHPIGPEVMGIHLVFAAEDVADVIRGCTSFLRTASCDISINIDCITMPPEPMAPPAIAGRRVVMVTGIHAGQDFAQAERDIQPLRYLATPLIDHCGPVDYTVLHHMLDPMIQKGRPAYAQSLYVGAMSDEAVRVIQAAVDKADPMTMVMVWPLGGAVAKVAPTDSAFGDRRAECIVAFDATADDRDQLAPYVEWVKSSYESLFPYAYNGGTYLNLAGLEPHLDAVMKNTYGANYARLVRLKAAYDTDNVFRYNVNIR